MPHCEPTRHDGEGQGAFTAAGIARKPRRELRGPAEPVDRRRSRVRPGVRPAPSRPSVPGTTGRLRGDQGPMERATNAGHETRGGRTRAVGGPRGRGGVAGSIRKPAFDAREENRRAGADHPPPHGTQSNREFRQFNNIPPRTSSSPPNQLTPFHTVQTADDEGGERRDARETRRRRRHGPRRLESSAPGGQDPRARRQGRRRGESGR